MYAVARVFKPGEDPEHSYWYAYYTGDPAQVWSDNVDEAETYTSRIIADEIARIARGHRVWVDVVPRPHYWYDDL